MLLQILLAYIAFSAVAVLIWSRALPPRENSSRAISRYLAKRDPHRVPHGDQPKLPSLTTPVHAASYGGEVQHDHA